MRRKKSSFIINEKTNNENINPLKAWISEKTILSDYASLDFKETTVKDIAKKYINKLKYKISRPHKISRYCSIIKVIRSFKWSNTLHDVIAGLSVGVAAVPMGVSYALLAQMPPQYGLYNNFYYPLIYTLFGTTNLCLGTSAIESLMSASAVKAILGSSGPADLWIDMSVAFSTFVGITLVVFRFLNIASLANFLADPIISGFSTGAAIAIGTSQIPHMLGIKLTRQPTLSTWYYAIQNIKKTNYICLLITIGGIIILALFQYLTKVYKFPFPGAIIMILFFLGLNNIFRWDLPPHNVPVIKAISSSFLKPRILLVELKYVPRLIIESFKYAVVYVVIHISIAKMMAKKHKQKVDASQEFLACSVCSLVGSFFQCFAIATSVSRSLIADMVQAKTVFYHIPNAFVVLITLTLITPYLKRLPLASLAAVVLFAVRGMICFEDFYELLIHRTFDVVLWLVCCISTIIYGPVEGITIGVLTSLFWLLHKYAYPNIVILGRLPNTTIYRDISRFPMAKEENKCKIIRFDSSLNFTNKHLLEEKVKELVEPKESNSICMEKPFSVIGMPSTCIEISQGTSSDTKTKKSHDESIIGNRENMTPKCISSENIILDYEKPSNGCVKAIILDVSGVNFLDLSAVKSLIDLNNYLKDNGCMLLFANWKGLMRDLLRSTDFHNYISTEHCFLCVHDAVCWAQYKIEENRQNYAS